VHRAIRHVLNGGKAANYEAGPAEMLARAQHCSQRERRADESSREVNERYQCAWMSKHVGSEFDGIISGVTSFGLSRMPLRPKGRLASWVSAYFS
jgi:ribonuclease R